VCFAASGAGAAPAPQLFRLTVSATSVARFDHTSPSASGVGCEGSLRAVGVRTAVFRSGLPLLVRFVGRRLQPVALRDLRGTVKLAGANTSSQTCASGGETQTPEPCPPTTRTFDDARVTFRSAGDGSIAIGTPKVSLRRGSCPREPNEFVALPLGQAPGPVHVSHVLLDNPRTKRITLTAGASRIKHYGDPEAGILRQRTAWKLTLVRTDR
jgi:hypothetical protein